MWLTHALQIAYTDTKKVFLKIVANLKDQKLSNTKVKKSYIFQKKKVDFESSYMANANNCG